MAVTAADVLALTGPILSEAVVNVLIADATILAGDCITGYDDERQDAIVKWLAAHLAASTSTGGQASLTSDKLGDASQSYARASTGDALRGTIYGQQALLLDTSGCLARKGKGRVSVEVI